MALLLFTALKTILKTTMEEKMIRMEMLLIHDDHNDHDEDDDGFQRMIVPDNVLQSDRRSPQ